MVSDLVVTIVDLRGREALEIAEDRLRRGENPDNILNDARTAVKVVRDRNSNGGLSMSELARSDEILKAIDKKVKPQRANESAVKRFFKSVFLNVSGDLNDIF
jgi:methanogenic corrinoid protein MtbC1